jgi:hypothetical protein
MQRREANPEAVKRFAVRSTQASAKLERRSVPGGYVRGPGVEKLLAARHQDS